MIFLEAGCDEEKLLEFVTDVIEFKFVGTLLVSFISVLIKVTVLVGLFTIGLLSFVTDGSIKMELLFVVLVWLEERGGDSAVVSSIFTVINCGFDELLRLSLEGGSLIIVLQR